LLQHSIVFLSKYGGQLDGHASFEYAVCLPEDFQAVEVADAVMLTASMQYLNIERFLLFEVLEQALAAERIACLRETDEDIQAKLSAVSSHCNFSPLLRVAVCQGINVS
jgi:hypothetical protein